MNEELNAMAPLDIIITGMKNLTNEVVLFNCRLKLNLLFKTVSTLTQNNIRIPDPTVKNEA